MATVSQHFHLSAGRFEFLNVHVERDNRLFIDPSAIRRGKDKYSRRADALLLGFFTEVLRCARSMSPADQAKGLGLLQSLHEPNETRLGYSTRGTRGHAFSDGMGSELWGAIVVNRAVHSSVLGASATIQVTVMTRLEDVPLFIKGVDRDLISDLTTRIVFTVLAEFTSDMMVKYPNIVPAGALHSRDVWHEGTKTLVPQPFSLPGTHRSGALLLVPEWWVDRRLIMNAYSFYNRYATQAIQDANASRERGGKIKRQSKKSIKAANRDVKRTNTSEAVHAAEGGLDLVGEYRTWTDTHVPLISEEDIARSLK